MRTLLKLSLLTLILVALAGCGGGDATQAAPTSDIAQTPVVPAVNTSTNILVTGDTSFTISETPYNAYSEEDMDGTMVRQFYFNNGSQQVVTIMFYGIEPAVGEYEITSVDVLSETAEGVTVLVMNNDTDPMVMYSMNPSGTLRVDSAGDSFSGSFDFTVEGGAMGAEELQTVEVTGAFANLKPLSR